MMPPVLTTADVAAALGIKPASVRRYASAGILPPPDGRLGRTPWWRQETIAQWRRQRPGQGVGGGRPRKDAR